MFVHWSPVSRPAGPVEKSAAHGVAKMQTMALSCLPQFALWNHGEGTLYEPGSWKTYAYYIPNDTYISLIVHVDN